jgi:hypothetical protein
MQFCAGAVLDVVFCKGHFTIMLGAISCPVLLQVTVSVHVLVLLVLPQALAPKQSPPALPTSSVVPHGPRLGLPASQVLPCLGSTLGRGLPSTLSTSATVSSYNRAVAAGSLAAAQCGLSLAQLTRLRGWGMK